MMNEEYKGEAHYWTEDADGDPVLPKLKSKEIQRWSDEAMFTAEPIDAQAGPKVHLLWMTADPLAVIAAPSKMYKGEVARSLRDVTHKERQEYVEQLKATKLKAPYEFVKFHFLIEGVTRAFTHQMVRQRTAVYAQESLRFAVKEDMPVALPPSLAGTKGVWLRWQLQAFGELVEVDSGIDEGDPRVQKRVAELMARESEAERQRWAWDQAVEGISSRYQYLVNSGVPAEDARGLLPHNTLTRLHYCTDLRALLDHAGNRLCTQAQFEWRLVFAKIAEAIRRYNPYDGLLRQAYNLGDGYARDFLMHCAENDRWQYEAIADLFRPVCYLTGKCEFKANFDRKCSIRERVDAFAERGTPSSQWHIGLNGISGESPHGVPINIEPVPPISAAEWLLDPGAAR
jgi:thymidylate synthase ThyX